jgi:hypothetical protein
LNGANLIRSDLKSAILEGTIFTDPTPNYDVPVKNDITSDDDFVDNSLDGLFEDEYYSEDAPPEYKLENIYDDDLRDRERFNLDCL